MQADLKRPTLQNYPDINDPKFLEAYDDLLKAGEELNQQVQSLIYAYDRLQQKGTEVSDQFNRVKGYRRNFLTAINSRLLNSDCLRSVPYTLSEPSKNDAIQIVDLGEAKFRGIIT